MQKSICNFRLSVWPREVRPSISQDRCEIYLKKSCFVKMYCFFFCCCCCGYNSLTFFFQTNMDCANVLSIYKNEVKDHMKLDVTVYNYVLLCLGDAELMNSYGVRTVSV